jgi:hypothetical protein
LVNKENGGFGTVLGDRLHLNRVNVVATGGAIFKQVSLDILYIAGLPYAILYIGG